MKHLAALTSIMIALAPVLSACGAPDTAPTEAPTTAPLAPNIPSTEAEALASSGEALLIDVRTPAEWAETGVPDGAATITLQDKDFADRVEALAKGDKNQPIVFICRSGGRSAAARDQLTELGYTRVTSANGGVEAPNGWIENDLPLTPYSEKPAP